MYVLIGPGSPVIQDWSSYPIIWNPPGWGSYSIPVGDISLPHVKIATLLGIKPGGVIPLHKDNPSAENNINESLVRYHLVLQTNAKCWNFHDGSWQQLQTGYLYTMDPHKEHASVNWGSTTRWHLILDIG